MKISANIMTFNEEECIERCINSIKYLVDEIIIVDTGSTDNTIDKIKSLNLKKIKLFTKNWNDNFSEIRNYMIKQSSKDIIMQIDADEFLDENLNKEDFNNLVLSNIKDDTALSFTIVNTDSSVISRRRPRVFLNNKEYSYYGRVHEQLINKEEYKIFSTDLLLYHYGYDKKIMEEKDKKSRNINLLLKMIEEDENIIWRFYYIRDLLVFGYDYSLIYKEIEKFILKYKEVKKEKEKRLYSKIEILKIYFEIFINGKFDYSKLEYYNNKYKYDVDYNYIMLYLNSIGTKKLLDKIFSIEEVDKAFDESIFSTNGEHLIQEIFKSVFLLDDRQRKKLFSLLSDNMKISMKKKIDNIDL